MNLDEKLAIREYVFSSEAKKQEIYMRMDKINKAKITKNKEFREFNHDERRAKILWSYPEPVTEYIYNLFKAGQIEVVLTIINYFGFFGLEPAFLMAISMDDIVNYFPFGCYEYQTLDFLGLLNRTIINHPQYKFICWWLYGDCQSLLIEYFRVPDIQEIRIKFTIEAFRQIGFDQLIKLILENGTYIAMGLNDSETINSYDEYTTAEKSYIRKINTLVKASNPYLNFTSIDPDYPSSSILNRLTLIGYRPIGFDRNGSKFSGRFAFFRSNLVDFGPIPRWNSKLHKLYPIEFRKQTFTMFCVFKRIKFPNHRDLLPYILNYMLFNSFLEEKEFAQNRLEEIKETQLIKWGSKGGLRDQCFDAFVNPYDSYLENNKYIRNKCAVPLIDRRWNLIPVNIEKYAEDVSDIIQEWPRLQSKFPKIREELIRARAPKKDLNKPNLAKLYVIRCCNKNKSLSLVMSKGRNKKKQKLDNSDM